MKPIIKKGLSTVIILLALLMISFLALPSVLEIFIAKKAEQDFKLDNFKININHIGLFNINAGRISIGNFFETDSIDIDFSLKSLMNGKVDLIQISGLTIKARLDSENQVLLDGFSLKSSAKGNESKKSADFILPPVMPEKVKLKNSKIVLTLPPDKGADNIHIPFEASSLITERQTTLFTDNTIMILGETFNINADFNLEKNIHNININSERLNLKRMSILAEPFAPGLNMPGNIRVGLRSDIVLANNILKATGRIDIYNPFTTPLKINYKSSLDIKSFDKLAVEAESDLQDDIKVLINDQTIFLFKPFFKFKLNGAPLKAEGNLAMGCGKAFVNSAGHNIKISGIKAGIPLSFPYKIKNKAAKGRFSIGSCVIDDKYKASINGKLSQIDKGFLAQGIVSLPDIKKFRPGFKVKALNMPEDGFVIKSNFYSKSFQFSSSDLAGFIPKEAEGIQFHLNLAADGNVDITPKGIKSNLKINIKNGEADIPESNIAVKGIATEFEIKNLLTMQSMPAQILSVDSIKINDILMTDALIRYNIESMDSLFLESSRIKWCKGIVSTESLRVPHKDSNYSTTLYCDRLELTDVLEQIGALQAQGNGTMSGRIPVTYKNGEISFDNGFLFSTPGQGGKIIVDKADKLTEGIPMNTPQFSQLDLAKEALKNYDYKWAKLNFNTIEDTLLVNMQFDGEPSNKVLPFEYKKELGRFVRVDASSPGSHFQGIKLDVNFKLPFNQVMKFGNKVKKAFK